MFLNACVFTSTDLGPTSKGAFNIIPNGNTVSAAVITAGGGVGALYTQCKVWRGNTPRSFGVFPKREELYVVESVQHGRFGECFVYSCLGCLSGCLPGQHFFPTAPPPNIVIWSSDINFIVTLRPCPYLATVSRFRPISAFLVDSTEGVDSVEPKWYKLYQENCRTLHGVAHVDIVTPGCSPFFNGASECGTTATNRGHAKKL